MLAHLLWKRSGSLINKPAYECVTKYSLQTESCESDAEQEGAIFYIQSLTRSLLPIWALEQTWIWRLDWKSLPSVINQRLQNTLVYFFLCLSRRRYAHRSPTGCLLTVWCILQTIAVSDFSVRKARIRSADFMPLPDFLSLHLLLSLARCKADFSMTAKLNWYHVYNKLKQESLLITSNLLWFHQILKLGNVPK